MLEGFWSLNGPPISHKEPMKDRASFLGKLKNVELNHAQVTRFRGWKACEICRKANGSSEYTCGGYTWPSGYAHYIQDHNIHPTEGFVQMINDALDDAIRMMPPDTDFHVSTSVPSRPVESTEAKEYILSAAVRSGDLIISIPRPARHHVIMQEISWQKLALTASHDYEQGFLTSTGRFVGRIAGCQIAYRANQIINKSGPDNQLFSEDMW